MTPQDSYKLVATIAAHRLLIRELIVLTFGRLPDPSIALDGFAKRLAEQLDRIALPTDPALSDAMAQEMADVVRDILEESKAVLRSLQTRSPPIAGPPS
jgi:hypothetical protein